MFKKTRIKLTAWYLLIIMLISVSFSMVIFRGLTNELDRLERIERTRVMRRTPDFFTNPNVAPLPAFVDPDVIAESKNRLTLILIAINVIILGGSAVAGYFLAGKTLKPIADMVDEQNRFISDASHELRTPLTALKSEIEVNLRNTALTLADAKKLIRSNLEEVNNLQSLSDNLIKLTHFQKNGNGIIHETVRLSSIAKDAVKKVALAAKQKSIRVTNKVPDVKLHGNAMLLTELLVILLDNAVKYSKKGKPVTLTAHKTDGHINIQVVDQGIGIHKEDLEHIFNRFYRADKSRTKTNETGYGLGLAIAKQIVDAHSGSIHVESAVGKGTTFTVKLPLK